MNGVFMERIYPPTRYDIAPYRTICYVKGIETTSVYIQLNDDEQAPDWVTIGDFLTKAFNNKLQDGLFIDECIKHYHGN